MILLKSLSKLKLRTCLRAAYTSERIKTKRNLKEISITNGGTLTGRLFMYLNKSNMVLESSTQSLTNTQDLLNRINHNLDINELKNTTITDMQRDLKVTLDTDLTRNLASVSSLRLKLLSTSKIVRILDIIMKITPNRITEYKFYKSAIKQLNEHIFFMNKDELLKSLFYLALPKTSRFTKYWTEKYLRCLEKYLECLTIEEICVICNCSFKTSTKIRNPMIINKVKYFMMDNLIILNDPALFIAFIKTIRHNESQDENLLSTISCALLFNKAYSFYSFGGLCHILALYADYFYYDENLFDVIVEQCLNMLQATTNSSRETYITEYIRNKDITRFLWVLSNINYKLKRSELDFVSSKIMEKVALNDYTNGLEDLVKCALYLWMLNYQSLDITRYYFRQKITETDINSDYKHRLSLLVTCIRRESPELYSQINEKPLGPTSSTYEIKQQIKNRTSLQRVLNVLKSCSSYSDLNRFELTCEIPYLNIVGITGFKKKIYKCLYIEILDKFTTLRNDSNSLNGLMALKMRLLNIMDGRVLKVEEHIIESLTEKQLEDYLKMEIKKLRCAQLKTAI